MRLLLISTDKNITDAGSAVRARMEHYGTLVHGIDVIAFGTGTSELIRAGNNVVIHPVSGNKLLAYIRAIFLARKIVQPDTVISVQDPFELGVWGVIVSRLTKKPLHVQIHIDFFSPYFSKESLRQRIQAWLAPFALHRAAAVRAVSWKIAQYVGRELGVPRDRIFVAPVFVDTSRVEGKPISVDLHAEYKEFEWIALVACRFVKQKNIPLAIDGFTEFRKSHPKCGLVIAGSGPEKEALEALIAERNAASYVKLGGWADHFASCMKTCDAFLMSSDYEGWGMTIIEAAACGKPIVMTDIGCAGEFIENKRNGLIVPVRDPKAIAIALTEIRDDKALSLRLADEAKKDASTYMTRAENNALLLDSWKKALSNI